MCSPNMKSVNILSIDVEEWYHMNYSSMDTLQKKPLESRVRANMEVLLRTLSEHQARATFFFLGSVAEQYPDLVRETHRMGQEIASHGYAHELVYQQSRDEFAQDLRKSAAILQDITGEKIKGYRAPSWSVSDKTPWVYEVLVEAGFVYDASLFPFTTFLYGDSQAPVTPFAWNINGQKLYEMPATVLKLGHMRFPFGGGFYFRAFPAWATRLAMYITNRQGRVVVFYLHPREIDPEQPRLELPLRDYFISYVNLKTTLKKLKGVLSLGQTISISRYLEENAPALSLISHCATSGAIKLG